MVLLVSGVSGHVQPSHRFVAGNNTIPPYGIPSKRATGESRARASNHEIREIQTPHIIRRPGVPGGTRLAAFLAAVHVANDAITAMLGAPLPTLQARFGLGPAILALIVAVHSIAS
ncbi:hypothetical protein [Nonomuraea rubra]|uniref:Uncharacterized protein n=1 Tax=Nonomuraea rubra TaxID=46180 RepID=A0A7X0P1N4_9ACTN|nr:hypothetical protein [Nonomuraea rubra]MBB6553615.1 hypothetical protein [Nonomuraea rubra]